MLKHGINKIKDAKRAWNEIEPYSDWFDSSITKAYGDTYDGATFYLYANGDGEVIGIGIAGYKHDDDLYENEDTEYLQDVPFIWELGTCVNNPDKKEKGVANKIIESVINDNKGLGFWLKTLDADADSFWKHFADKYGMNCDLVGVTAWDTPIYDFSFD